MRTPTRLMIAIIPFALAACSEQSEPEQNMPMASQDMPMNGAMPMSGQMGEAMGQMANAQGTVTAIDDEAGTITIDHGPVEAVDWPAMTMAFEADESERMKVKVGDEVTFDFRMTDSGSEITSIEKK
ncbi:MAG: copper-binding protein [Pigmentiphaga sp.]